MEESYAPVSGLVALVENSSTIEPGEFLMSFEGMQSRSTTVLLDEASLLRLNRDGRWQWPFHQTIGYPGRYIALSDVARTLSMASARPNQFILSPPFKSEAAGPSRRLRLPLHRHGGDHRCRTLNYDTLLDGIALGPVPRGHLSDTEGAFSLVSPTEVRG